VDAVKIKKFRPKIKYFYRVPLDMSDFLKREFFFFKKIKIYKFTDFFMQKYKLAQKFKVASFEFDSSMI